MGDVPPPSLQKIFLKLNDLKKMCKANPSKHEQAINSELTLNTTNCLVSLSRKENQTVNSK